MTQVYTYEIVGQLFGTNLIQSGSIEDANQHRLLRKDSRAFSTDVFQSLRRVDRQG